MKAAQGMVDPHKVKFDEDVSSRAAGLARPSATSRNLWQAYLSSFYSNTVIEGKKISEWLAHFSVTPIDATGLPLERLPPKEVNEYVVILIRRNNEAYHYYNKLSTASSNLEDVLSGMVKKSVQVKLQWYRDNPKDEEGRYNKCPAKEKLVLEAEAELDEEFGFLSRGKLEARFFETVIQNLKTIMMQVNNICTANAHEIKLMEAM